MSCYERMGVLIILPQSFGGTHLDGYKSFDRQKSKSLTPPPALNYEWSLTRITLNAVQSKSTILTVIVPCLMGM